MAACFVVLVFMAYLGFTKWVEHRQRSGQEWREIKAEIKAKLDAELEQSQPELHKELISLLDEQDEKINELFPWRKVA